MKRLTLPLLILGFLALSAAWGAPPFVGATVPFFGEITGAIGLSSFAAGIWLLYRNSGNRNSSH